jgi:hypothetical protein
MNFRDLTADEIEVRVASVSERGVSLLLYKNARVDANILDETVGAENWQNKFYECKGNLYCSVGINTNFSIPESPERWIWKDDCGSESDYEKVKGEASDAFKRACATKWGIGRELYTSPFIWVTDCNIERGANGKLTCRDFFKVSKIEIVKKKITKLELKCKNKVVFSYGYDRKAKPEVKESEKPVICPKCGIQILNTPTRSGKILSPDEVLIQWGMCENCKREELKIQKELEQLKNERK